MRKSGGLRWAFHASLPALMAGFVAVGPPAKAADATPAATSSQVQEVIVTATRREEKLKDVPISASVLSGDPLAVLGTAGQDVRQLAFTVPSLNIESSNGRTFPRFYIRGYGNTDFNSFASQPVSLIYDDVVQENAALKGFPVFDEADVEVLRGPQGTLFGLNTPAGVVRLRHAADRRLRRLRQDFRWHLQHRQCRGRRQHPRFGRCRRAPLHSGAAPR
jgi:iron complex outermembrane receptor protein